MDDKGKKPVNNQKKDTILALNMFSGSYLKENLVENTAHETINIFRPSDSDEYYLYAPKTGEVNSEGRFITKVLMVRYLGSGINPYSWQYEVIGRAYIDEQPLQKSDQKSLFSSIKYDGVSLDEIMSKGGQPFLKREESEEYIEMISFKSRQCQKPTKPIIINCLIDENYGGDWVKDTALSTEVYIRMQKKDKDEPWRLFGTDQKRYLEEDATSAFSEYDPYKCLNELFLSTGIWEDFPSVEEYREEMERGERNKDLIHGRFLSLINKEDSELAYSNMLAFFLNESTDLCKRFVSFLLTKLGFDESEQKDADLLPLDIARERKYIDLLINTDSRVFILENKVNAFLRDSQLQDYVNKVKDILYKEDLTNKSVEIFILCPRRNALFQQERNGLSEKVQINGQEKIVPVITYSDIASELNEEEKWRSLPYFEDFIAVLNWQENNKHEDRSERFLRSSKKRFLRAIDIARASSNGDADFK